jgi:hypothetical protein
MEPQNSVPFEDTSQPFFSRLFRTAVMAFSEPMKLFSGMPRGDIGLPLLYGVITGTIAGIISIFWHMSFSGMALLTRHIHVEEFAVSTGLYLLFMFLCPLLAAVGMFISAAINHICLLLFGAGNGGFVTTFRGIAYGNTPALLCIIPFCGGVIGGIWAMVLVIIAYKIGHETDWWRAILAYFLPTIFCCCMIIWLLMTFGVIGALAN